MRVDAGVEATVIVPAYNEEKGVPVVLEAIEQLSLRSLEVIVVDDGSTDGTAGVAKRYSCRLVSHARNLGKGAAMRTGIDASRGEKIVFIDADGTYPVSSIPDLLSALDTYDMVVGARTHGNVNIPVLNRLGNVLIRKALRCLYGTSSKDPLTGLYGLRKDHLMRMQLTATGFGIESEITIKAARMGLTVTNLPIAYYPRIGKAKLHPLRDGYRILKTILCYAPLYNPGLVFMAPGVAACIASLTLLLRRVLGQGSGLGPTGRLTAALLALIGIQLIVSGIAVKLYAVAHKFTAGDLVTRIFGSPRLRRGLSLLGLGSLSAGLAMVIRFLLLRAPSVAGGFSMVWEAELGSFLIMCGVQIVLSAVFLSVFTKEVLRQQSAAERKDEAG